MYEGIAPRKVFQDVGIVDIIQGDAQMLKPTERSPALWKFPVDRRHDMGDVGALKSLWTAQGLKSATWFESASM